MTGMDGGTKEGDDKPAPARAGLLRAAATDLARCLRFYSRLPVGRLPWEAEAHAMPDFRTAPRMLPLAGAIIGAAGATVLWFGLAAGLGGMLAAALAVATLTLITGAFHEDGLADTADGFGGGQTPQRRLEIMKDSRIGAFGAAALMLAFILRIAALGTLADRGGAWAAALAVVAAAAVSRTAGLLPLALLPPARTDGASAAAGRPTAGTMAIALAIAAIVAAAGAASGMATLRAVALALVLAVIPALVLTRLARRLIGGQTGDVAGAVQQMAEIAFMVGLIAAMRS